MLRILHVDDEEVILSLYREELLETFSDCDIRQAYSGEEALRLLGEYAPDIVLLDIKMQGMDGIEVLQRIKSINPHIAVFLVTAYASFALDPASWHADDYIIKTADLNELTEKISFFVKHRRTKSNIYQESLPFPIAYNIVALRSRINAKEILDHLFNLTEYVMKYLVCVLLAQCLTMDSEDALTILGKYRHKNMTMGKWYELLVTLGKLNRRNTNPFMPELYSFFLSSSNKFSDEISYLQELISIRNEIHKRPFSERGSEKTVGHIKKTLWAILDKCIFLKNYFLQVVETAMPDHERQTFIYHVKNLMGSHPEFLLTPIQDSTILPYRKVFLRKANSSKCLELHPYILFDFCPETHRDDVFLFEKINKGTVYKSSQQGHCINMDMTIRI